MISPHVSPLNSTFYHYRITSWSSRINTTLGDQSVIIFVTKYGHVTYKNILAFAGIHFVSWERRIRTACSLYVEHYSLGKHSKEDSEISTCYLELEKDHSQFIPWLFPWPISSVNLRFLSKQQLQDKNVMPKNSKYIASLRFIIHFLLPCHRHRKQKGYI